MSTDFKSLENNPSRLFVFLKIILARVVKLLPDSSTFSHHYLGFYRPENRSFLTTLAPFLHLSFASFASSPLPTLNVLPLSCKSRGGRVTITDSGGGHTPPTLLANLISQE